MSQISKKVSAPGAKNPVVVKKGLPSSLNLVVTSAFELAAIYGFRPRGLLFETPAPEPTPAPAPDPMKEIARIEATITSLTAQVRKLGKTDPAPITPGAPVPEESNKERIAKLEKALADKETAEKDGRRSKTVEDAIRARGIEGVGFEDALAVITTVHGKDIKYNDKGSVVYEDPETAIQMPVSEFLEKKFLIGARKDRYTASTNKGGGRLERPAQGGGQQLARYQDLSPEVRSKMTDREKQEYARNEYLAGKK